jgi:hypothetical protein
LQRDVGAAVTATFIVSSTSPPVPVELEYFLVLSRDLGLASAELYQRLEEEVLEVQHMLAALLRKVDAARNPSLDRSK